MKTLIRNLCLPAVMLAGLLGHNSALAQYNQALVAAFVTGANQIDKDATANTSAAFRTAVGLAFTNGNGGVFNLPTTVAAGTTVYRGTYGDGKRVHITSSTTMQNITSSATSFTVLSPGNGTTSSTDQNDYTLTFGLFDTNTSLPLIDEAIKEIGLPILSRNGAGYPLDLRVTVTFSDSSTQVATANIGLSSSGDDTFFGFTAPEGLSIVSVRLQSFVPTTETPRTTRIAWDDFGFITGPAFVTPQPQIVNASPAPYNIINPTNGIHFEALTYVPIDPTNISLVLNSTDVSAGLIVSGDPTNYSVSYFGLVPDEEYQMTIGVTNDGGVAVLSRIFYTKTNSFVLYDSGGFADETAFPLGPLQNVTHDRGVWTPNAGCRFIVDAGGAQGKALQREVTGFTQADVLSFPPVSSGILITEFDVLVSATYGRTIDISLTPPGSANMASFLAWGETPDKLSYFTTEWVPIADVAAFDWHHVVITNYLSGPVAGKYDVSVNGVSVAKKLSWRNVAVGSALGGLRIQVLAAAALFEYGWIDNLVISAAPEDPSLVGPPQIGNFNVTHQTMTNLADLPEGFQFTVSSELPISAGDITVLHNGNNVSGSLDVTGSETNLLVAYGPLANGTYAMSIAASNASGVNTASRTFIATDEPWLVHPANGWLNPWQWSIGFPELRTADPLDESGGYLRLNAAGGTFRNFMRQYQSGAVDITKPHYIRWKFRLSEPDFATQFVSNNDRVHFFGRNGNRITASTDAAVSWMIFGAGAAASDISGGQTFWTCDAFDNSAAYNTTTAIDTHVPIVPFDIYAFEIYVLPEQYGYYLTITNESATVNNYYTSASIQKFRNVTAPVDSFTFLHFGTQASAAAKVRPFDLGPVSVTQAAYIATVTLINPARSGADFSFSFQSQTGVTHTAEYRDNVVSGGWTPLQTVTGDGGVKTITHTNAPAGPLYYRVNSQLP